MEATGRTQEAVGRLEIQSTPGLISQEGLVESSLVGISQRPMQLGLYRLLELLEGIIMEEGRGKIMEAGMHTAR